MHDHFPSEEEELFLSFFLLKKKIKVVYFFVVCLGWGSFVCFVSITAISTLSLNMQIISSTLEAV